MSSVVSAIVYQRRTSERRYQFKYQGGNSTQHSDRRQNLEALARVKQQSATVRGPSSGEQCARWCQWRAGTRTRSGFTVTQSPTRDSGDSRVPPSVSKAFLLWKPFPVQERPACALSVLTFAGGTNVGGSSFLAQVFCTVSAGSHHHIFKAGERWQDGLVEQADGIVALCTEWRRAEVTEGCTESTGGSEGTVPAWSGDCNHGLHWSVRQPNCQSAPLGRRPSVHSIALAVDVLPEVCGVLCWRDVECGEFGC